MTVELDLCSLLCTPVLLNTTIDWRWWSSAAIWEKTTTMQITIELLHGETK